MKKKKQTSNPFAKDKKVKKKKVSVTKKKTIKKKKQVLKQRTERIGNTLKMMRVRRKDLQKKIKEAPNDAVKQGFQKQLDLMDKSMGNLSSQKNVAVQKKKQLQKFSAMVRDNIVAGASSQLKKITEYVIKALRKKRVEVHTPKYIGEWRFSDKNDCVIVEVDYSILSAVVPTYLFLAVFEDGTVTYYFFNDKDTSESHKLTGPAANYSVSFKGKMGVDEMIKDIISDLENLAEHYEEQMQEGEY